MGHKRKGQLTTDIEWHKHIRKIGKRFFWKGERKAEKKMFNENISELNEMNEIPLLTFDELFDLIEENRFENLTDKKIAEKIFEAERDWKMTSQESLNDFMIVLENEIGGTVTMTSLEKLLKKYNRKDTQFGWEAESVCSLLEIFKLTKETDLRNIFSQLAKKVT